MNSSVFRRSAPSGVPSARSADSRSRSARSGSASSSSGPISRAFRSRGRAIRRTADRSRRRSRWPAPIEYDIDESRLASCSRRTPSASRRAARARALRRAQRRNADFRKRARRERPFARLRRSERRLRARENGGPRRRAVRSRSTHRAFRTLRPPLSHVERGRARARRAPHEPPGRAGPRRKRREHELRPVLLEHAVFSARAAQERGPRRRTPRCVGVLLRQRLARANSTFATTSALFVRFFGGAYTEYVFAGPELGARPRGLHLRHRAGRTFRRSGASAITSAAGTTTRTTSSRASRERVPRARHPLRRALARYRPHGRPPGLHVPPRRFPDPPSTFQTLGERGLSHGHHRRSRREDRSRVSPCSTQGKEHGLFAQDASRNFLRGDRLAGTHGVSRLRSGTQRALSGPSSLRSTPRAELPASGTT